MNAEARGGRPGVGRRASERRRGLVHLVHAVATQVATGQPSTKLLPLFEARVAELLGADWVRIVRPGRHATPALGSALRVCEVPGPQRGHDLLFEVGIEGGLLDAWDRQLIESAGLLLGLAMSGDRNRHDRVDDAARSASAAPLIGASASMRSLRARIERVALTHFTVLIQGESGTGKELVARQIHDLSPRRSGPFVAVNCAALVETLLEAELFGIEDRTATGVKGRRGKFELADGGTLFLDEVADLSITAQAKLLRAIQDLAVERVGGHTTRRLNVRIVAATNKPLAELAASGLFRADLYYRLSGLEVHVPPLRQRREDVLELTQYFLACHGDGRGNAVSMLAADALQAYEWPGNVRELQRTLEGALAMSGSCTIDLEDLPAALRAPYTDAVLPSLEADESLRTWASRYTRMVLARVGHNKRRACRVLGISYHTLQAHLRYGQPQALPREEDGAA